MLGENIKEVRKSKGLSQEELALKLNVVRQTVSKWENGLSVPDSEALIAISEVLETPVSILLGEKITEPRTDELRVISEKLEVINLQLAQKNEARRRIWQWIFIAIGIFIILIFLILAFMRSPYLEWDYTDPELAVVGTILHGFEFIFVRTAPFVLIGAIVGAILTRKKRL